MKHALFPGSFDPPTLGHLNLIERISRQADRTTVAVIENPNKPGLFPFKERVELLRSLVAANSLPADRIQVSLFSGLLVDYVRQLDYPVVVRGLRSTIDMEFEFQMAHLNQKLDSKVETMFLATRPELSAVSSSYVREIGRYGGDISQLVPSSILEQILPRLRG